jgi:hypothetical protein
MFQEGAVDYTPESLMLAAKNHFNTLKLEQEWEPKSAAAAGDDPNTILALQTCIKGLKDGHRKTPKNGRGGKRNADGSRHWTGKMAWKGVKSKDGDASSKTVGDIQYHWCPNHNALAESTKSAVRTPTKRTWATATTTSPLTRSDAGKKW